MERQSKINALTLWKHPTFILERIINRGRSLGENAFSSIGCGVVN